MWDGHKLAHSRSNTLERDTDGLHERGCHSHVLAIVVAQQQPVSKPVRLSIGSMDTHKLAVTGKPREIRTAWIVVVEDRDVVVVLRLEDPQFCALVVFQRAVSIQMIWRDVGYGRCIAVKTHDVFQLKTRQFADHDAALWKVNRNLA